MSGTGDIGRRRARMEKLARRLGPAFTGALAWARLRLRARRALSWYCPDDCWDL